MPLARKSLRDVVAARGPLAGLAVLVAVATALMAGGSRARDMLAESREGWTRRLRLADVDYRFPPRSPGVASKAAALVGVVDAEERLVVPGRAVLGEGLPRRAWIHGLPEGGASRLDTWHLLVGRWPRVGEVSAVVDRSVASTWGTDVGGHLTVEVGGTHLRLPVVGIAVSPEYLVLPVHPDYALPLRGSVAVVGVSNAAVAALGLGGMVNGLLLDVDDAAPGDVRARLAALLPPGTVDTGTRDDHPGRVLTAMIVTDFELYIPPTVAVLVGVALLLLGLAIARLIRRQRAVLGTLLALGHQPASLVASTLPLALVPTALGVLLGALAHGPLASAMFEGFADALGYAPLLDPGPGPALAVATGSCLGAALLASLVASATMCVRPPARLLFAPTAPSVGASSALVLRVALRIAALLRLPTAARMGILGAVRRGATTVVGAAVLGACIALVIAFLLVHVTSRREIEASVARMGLDATVEFAEPVGPEAVVAAAVRVRGDAEPVVTGRLTIVGERGAASVRCTGVPPGKFTARLIVREGRRFTAAGAREILVDRRAARRASLRVGESVEVRPTASGEGVRLEVVGIVDGLTFGTAVLPIEVARSLLGTGERVTGAFVATSASPAEVTAALDGIPGVEHVTACPLVVAEVDRSVGGSTRILIFALFAAIVVAVVFFGIVAALDAADRARDLATLRALGWGEGAVFVIGATEVLLRTLLAVALALAAAPPLARWLLERTVHVSQFPMDLQTPWWVLAAPVAVALVLSPLAALPAWRAGRRGLAARTPRLLANE